MGDPETQAVLPLMQSDLVELVKSALDKKLLNFELQWHEGASCCVVATSEGYPGKYNTGFEIDGMDKTDRIFVSGIVNIDGIFKTSGGRVLCTQATGTTMENARKKAYSNLENIDFKGMYYRRDIGSL
jgi:phosphoribosylamine--glycine ligase